MKVAQVLLFAWVVVFAFWAINQVMRRNKAADKVRKAAQAAASDGDAMSGYKASRNSGG